MDCALTAAWWLGAAAALLGVVSYCLFVPVNWTKDLHDVGFEAGSRLWGARRRVGAAADALRRRRVGGLPPVFPNGWFAVLESCLLARGVHHVTALGLNLAVFRGESGRVRVLDAYCPHMGANMAVGGRVRGDCLECPFHNWCFDGRDGKCTAVPYSQKVPEFAKVRCWECRDVNGFVFVWFHAEGAPPAWEPQPVVAVDSASWAFAGRNEFLAACHIQEIPENGADVSHFNCLHGPGIGIPCLSRHLYEARWRPGEGERQHTAELQLNHELNLFGKVRLLSMHVKANQIGPGYVEMFLDTYFGPIVILQSVTPIEPLLQKVVHRMYCPPLLVPYAKIVLIGECIMFERDLQVLNHKQFQDKPMLVKEDRLISRYRRWYSQFYSENSPKNTLNTLDW